MRVTFTVNGELREADDVWEGESLLYVLRERMGLAGSKNACEQGECGSCTVYLDGVTCCACLVAAGQADGRRVDTVEGLGGADGELHPVQQAYLDAGAVQCGFCTPGLLVATHDLLARDPDPDDSEIREALAGNLCRCTGYEKIIDAVRLAARRLSMRLVVDGCAVATMDGDRTEHAVGHVVVDGARIESVAEGRAPRDLPDATYVDGTGCLATPGFVNTHHHLYQWLTRGMAVDHTLFDWLTTLYPVWAGLDEDTVRVGATGALVQLARTGCTTTTDHHYVFPAGGGDLLGAEIEAARAVGLRFLPTRGSMDLGRSRGGLPPDQVVEELDAILAATADAIDRHHDPSPDSMLRVGVAPCSPFSVTGDLLEAGRRAGPGQGRPPAHAPRRDHGRGRLLPGEVRLRPGRVRRVARLARPGRVVRARDPPRRQGHRRPGLQRHRRRALPLVQRPARAPASAAPATCATPASPSGSASTGPRPTRRRRWSRRSATRCCSPVRSAGRRR